MYYLCTYRDNCQILCTYRLEKIVVNGDYPQLVECLVGVTSCYKQQTSASEKQGVTVRKCGAPGENDLDLKGCSERNLIFIALPGAQGVVSIQSSPIIYVVNIAVLPPSRMVLWIFQEKWEPPVWNRQLTSSFKASMYHLGWVHISSPAAYFIVALQKKPSATAALLICCCAGLPLWNWWL